MHYAYVLRSDVDALGATSDVRLRVAGHERACVRSASSRRPLRLVSSEACSSPGDACGRERYLKSHRGRGYLRQGLCSWLSEVGGDELDRR